MPHQVGAWCASAAAVLQAAVLIAGVAYSRRPRGSPVAWLLMAACGLMVARRLLEAGLPAADAFLGLRLAHDTAGLLVSALIVTGFGLVLWDRRVSRAAEPVLSAAPVGVSDVTSAREEEREILSYDLHDGLAQYVLASQMHLDTFAALRAGEAERAEQELDHARLRLREAAREVHRIISTLSLRVSPETSLSEAVAQYVGKLRETQGWQYEIDDRVGDRRFEPSVETMVFRVVQEALANAARHSQTDRVNVSIGVEAGALVASVRDWGVGFVPDEMRWDSRRVGLRSMCSRARLLGGRCEIESAPSQGTTVTIRVPCVPEGSGGHGH